MEDLTPQQRPLSPLHDSPSTPVSHGSASLEDRVTELEFKLATLSRLLLSAAQRNNALSTTPMQLRPISPLACARNNTPHLESPCPSRRGSSQNLFRDDDDDNNYEGEDLSLTYSLDPPTTMRRGQDSGPPPPPPPTIVVTAPFSSNEFHPPPPLVQKSTQQKWMDYLNTFQELDVDVDVQMQEFIRVPSQLEYLVGYGFWICVDCFLYILTILPIRFCWSCLLLSGVLRQRFHRRHLYQLIQVGIIFTVYRFLLLPISIGKLYHWIRGQAMLKLYVLIAIVEVFDRLMCSLGQDCLDSMYCNTTRRPRSLRMLISVLVVLVYVGFHTLILFVHVATLNVAMNSADQALLTLLISGNFAEIKSTVFKKYNKANLFKITASDVCERFKLALFLGLVLLLNQSQGMTWSQALDYAKMCGIVCCTEVVADWIKHSFITKFNFIPSQVYGEYALLLAGDVTGIIVQQQQQQQQQQEGGGGACAAANHLDHTHAVVKRIGLAQVPLVCVLARYATEAARYSSHYNSTRDFKAYAVLLAAWCTLLALKCALGRRLQTVSQGKLQNAPELPPPPTTTTTAKKKKE